MSDEVTRHRYPTNFLSDFYAVVGPGFFLQILWNNEHRRGSVKPILVAACSLTALLIYAGAHAQTSTLSIACKGGSTGAEVSINGQFKGECPLDVRVPAGVVKLRAVKKVDDKREQVFEQEIRLGEDVTKKVDVVLSAPRAIAAGQGNTGERPTAAAAARDSRPAPVTENAAPPSASSPRPQSLVSEPAEADGPEELGAAAVAMQEAEADGPEELGMTPEAAAVAMQEAKADEQRRKAAQALQSTPPTATAARPAAVVRDNVRNEPAWLGAVFDMPEPMKRLWLDRIDPKGGNGALVIKIEANSPAAKAGLRRGDVVRSVNGGKVELYPDLDRHVAYTGAGQTLKLGIIRFSKPHNLLSLDPSDKPASMSLDVTLTTRPAEQTASRRTLRGYVALGAGVASAKVCAKPDTDDSLDSLEGRLDCTITDARGGFLFENVRDKLKYVAQFVEDVQAAPGKFMAGAENKVRKLRNLFSTDTGDENMQINPVTDLIVRTAAYESTGRHDDESVWKAPPVSPGVLEQISKGVARMLNLESRAPLSDPDFVPDPDLSRYDATLESSKISIENGKAKVADINGKVMATAPLEAIARNALEGNAMVVPYSESREASNLAFDKRKHDIRDLYGEIRVTPDSVRVNQTTTFTVRGKSLIEDMSFELEKCTGTRELPGGTDTERRFSCKIASPGTATGQFKFMPGGTTLKTFYVTARNPEDKEPQAPAARAPAAAPTPQASAPRASAAAPSKPSTPTATAARGQNCGGDPALVGEWEAFQGADATTWKFDGCHVKITSGGTCTVTLQYKAQRGSTWKGQLVLGVVGTPWIYGGSCAGQSYSGLLEKEYGIYDWGMATLISDQTVKFRRSGQRP